MDINKVFLDVTNRCNANCIYCFTDSNSKTSEEMTDLDIVQFIESIYKMGINKISIGGGEPFLRNLPKIIEQINNNIKVSVTSNGSIINDEIIECLIKYQIKLTISLDSLNEAHFQEVRKGLNLELIKSNIIKLVQFNEIKKNLSLRSTVTTQNIEDIYNIIDFCDKVGVPKLKVNSTNEFGRARNNTYIIPKFEQFSTLLNKLQEYSSGKLVEVELPITKYLGNKENICTLGKKSIYIDSYGELYPCAFSEGELSQGNVRSNNIEKLIDKLGDFNYESPICVNCPIHRYE